MRLRHVHDGQGLLSNHPQVIIKPEAHLDKINDFIKGGQELQIEIGSGKGQFIRKLAYENPQSCFLGIEASTKVIARWLYEIDESLDQPNYRILHTKAEMLPLVFQKPIIDKIYLNFSDPWPKPRHAKRRLTSPEHMVIYEGILKKQGHLEFKTDNVSLFDYSVMVIRERGWILEYVERDLYHSEHLNHNVPTEYEEKFVEEGKPIYKLCASWK